MKISGGAGNFKVVMKFTKVVLCHSKTRRVEPSSRYIFFKAGKDNHRSEKEMILQQGLQKTRRANKFCQNKLFVMPMSSNTFQHILQSFDNDIPLYAADILKLTLWAIYDQRFIINITVCHKDPHKSLKLFIVAFLPYHLF